MYNLKKNTVELITSSFLEVGWKENECIKLEYLSALLVKFYLEINLTATFPNI